MIPLLLLALWLQEEVRRVRALKQRHISEREEIADAHERQFSEFHIAWDKYIAEFDAMAEMYTGQMQDKHADHIAGFQEGLQVCVFDDVEGEDGLQFCVLDEGRGEE